MLNFANETLFLDFEASSLGQDSYPIEIALVNEGLTFGYSAIINPAKTWVDWSPISQQIHRLSEQNLVDYGEDISEVIAKTSNFVFANRVYTDATTQDTFWLKRLYDAGHDNHIPPTLSDYNSLTKPYSLIKTDQNRQVLKTTLVKAGITLHTALDDALSLAIDYNLIKLVNVPNANHDSAIADLVDRAKTLRDWVIAHQSDRLLQIKRTKFDPSKFLTVVRR